MKKITLTFANKLRSKTLTNLVWSTQLNWKLSWGHKEQRAWSLVRRALLAYVYNGVSVTTECLSGGKWLLYTTALWP